MVAIAAVPARVVSAAVLEVWVHAGLLSGEPARGIILQQGFEEVQTVVIQARDECIAFGALPLGERRFEIGERRNTWPRVFIRGAEKSVKGQEE